jgi:hypothetical protein
MAMSVSITRSGHSIWQSGGVILAAGIAGTLVLQILVYHFVPASLVASGLLVLLLIVGLSSPFHAR